MTRRIFPQWGGHLVRQVPRWWYGSPNRESESSRRDELPKDWWHGSPSRASLCLMIVLLTSSMACIITPACAQPESTAPEAVETHAPLPWPTRASIGVYEIDVGPWVFTRVGWFGLGGVQDDLDDAALVADPLNKTAVRFEEMGSIVVRMPEGELSATARLAGKPIAAYKVLTTDPRPSNSENTGEDTDEQRIVQLQRTWFVLYEPRNTEKADATKGVVLLFPGMFGTPEPVIDGLIGQLRNNGWHVLRMLTHSSRFTEQASYTLDPQDGLGEEAEAIANELGDRAAECALAVEAVCAHIAKTRLDIPIDRRIALGMSGGGMVLPTIVAREHDAYKAAVFIGGGCDFAAISMESNYADWIDAVRIEWASEPTDMDRTAFAFTYRDAAPFDSYHTATLMADIPTLMLHGSADKAVPASLGDLLWTRLGEPERWEAPIGHEVLFMGFLPAKVPALLDWLDEVVKENLLHKQETVME